MPHVSPDRFFDLPDAPSPRSDPALVATDERHFAAIAEALASEVHGLEDRLARLLRAPARGGQEAVQRDAELRRLEARLRGLRGVGSDACLGRMTRDTGARVHIGRLGLKDRAGTALLIDWRSPAAEPFFAATRAEPMGLTGRRRYRWSGGRVRDYSDESLDAARRDPATAPDDEATFLDQLAEVRTPRMRDVLSTIAADQDAIVRADARRPLVVDGGPGTGKTVVALHRAAYLQYTDPRLRDGTGRLLVIGPHRPYLRYVADVLPGLGEDDVITCTLADLVPEGADAIPETDPRVRALKDDARMLEAVDRAIAFSEEAPTSSHEIDPGTGPLGVRATDWAMAIDGLADGTPHDLAPRRILAELAAILAERAEDDEEAPDPEDVLTALERDEEVVAALRHAWPILRAPQVVADLWEVPALLRHCAPWLTDQERALLRRAAPQRWTVADLPLLDAARARLGDPEAESRARRRRIERDRARAELDDVVADLIASDDSEMLQMSMLRGEDLRSDLDAAVATATPPPDALEGPFLHVVVDEAQELGDAAWQMVLRRCPSRSLTIVGDRAQAADGFEGTWTERLARVGMDRIELAPLSVNYRTPAEIMEVAGPEIRAVVPEANVPTSIRESGVPVRHVALDVLPDVVEELRHRIGGGAAGTAAIIGVDLPDAVQALVRELGSDRLQVTTPQLTKGLEFDTVVLVSPQALGTGRSGAAARYVAMTRATRELVVVGGAGTAVGGCAAERAGRDATCPTPPSAP